MEAAGKTGRAFTTVMNKFFFILIGCCLSMAALSQQGKRAPKPLYRDPVYDGAADPVVIYNKQEKKWWMLYTNRRANITNAQGVDWCHGTRIGIAESADGATWKYLDTTDIGFRPNSGYTFWAPDVIEHDGTFHMYLTYVPGVFTDWNHPREIIHLTSKDLHKWKYESTLSLVNKKVLDATVFRLPDGTWRLWYNNEPDGKSIWYADSKDLYNWTDKGKAIAARGEGPKVFTWKGTNWMIVDVWKGMELYQSDDLLNWKKQTTRILEEPGKGAEDQAIGGHPDVLVQGDKAYLFYFTHPGRKKENPAPAGSYDDRRTLIQMAELKYMDGVITCDRDQVVYINLK
jgi:beta-xylosidase